MNNTFNYNGHTFTAIGQIADSMLGSALSHTRHDEHLDKTFNKYKGTYDYDMFYKTHGGEADIFKLEGFDKPVIPCANTFMIWEGKTQPYDENRKTVITNLKQSNIEQLKEWGYTLKDIEQIDKIMNHTVFKTSRGKQISMTTAKRMLGINDFLSGMCRAAFHWSAVRGCANGKGTVSFDCSKWYKGE